VGSDKSTIQLVVCTDDNFVAHTATLLQSIKETNAIPVHVHILAKLSDANRAKLMHMSSAHFNLTIITDLPDYSALPISKQFKERLSEAAFWRLAIPLVLHDYDKALYLDSDMIVIGDITALWEEKINDVAVAAVEDSLLKPQAIWEKLEKTDSYYFNSGMMLINLKKWREDNLMEKTVGLVKDNPDWPYNDQHALNVALDGKVRLLANHWNVQTQCLLNNSDISPTIVHFTGFEKPWHKTSNHPYTNQYRLYRDRTEYKTDTYLLVMDADDKKLIDSLTSQFPEGGSIGIWGVGMRGRRIVHFINEFHPEFKIEALIDKKVQGDYQGLNIHNRVPDIFLDALLIATIPHRDSIIDEISYLKSSLTFI